MRLGRGVGGTLTAASGCVEGRRDASSEEEELTDTAGRMDEEAVASGGARPEGGEAGPGDPKEERSVVGSARDGCPRVDRLSP